MGIIPIKDVDIIRKFEYFIYIKNNQEEI